MSEKRAPYDAGAALDSSATERDLLRYVRRPAPRLVRAPTDDAPSPARAVLDSTATERDLLLYVLQLARLNGWLVRHDWTRLHSPSGYPDLTLLRPPRLVYAELKRESGRPTERQAEWIEALRGIAGIEVYVWRPHDAEEIARVLE